MRLLRSLRNRLALSHTLPILVFVPLLGLTLLYQLERRYFLDNLAKELAVQGALIANFTRNNPEIWQDPTVAQDELQTLQSHVAATLELVDSKAIRLAASAPAENAEIGLYDPTPLLQEALRGEVVWAIDRTAPPAENVIDVAVPVINSQDKLEGVIRLSQQLTDIQARVTALRWLVLITLLIGAFVSLGLGLALARSIGAPLLQLTDAVASFTPGRPPQLIPATGPDELRTLATTLNHMEERLYELERSRALLLSGVVHELARPLGAMKAAAQTICRSNDMALGQDLAHGIDEQIDQLQFHLDDLALLGELEIQGLQLTRTATDLAELVREQCNQIAPLAQRRQLRLDCKICTPLPVIQADPKRIGQIIGNLLHNACKYTPPGGKVTVSCTLRQEEAHCWTVVAVADNGPGIPRGQEEQIFHYFYRSPAHRRIHQGMGIGLALARQLADAHGGLLTAENLPAGGACFTLKLPC
ncbi:MAG: ATP-binding protein [Caldilineaceae bacterium]